MSSKGPGNTLMCFAMLGTGLCSSSVASCSTFHSCLSELLGTSRCPGGCGWLPSGAFFFCWLEVPKTASRAAGLGSSGYLKFVLSVSVPTGVERIGSGTCWLSPAWMTGGLVALTTRSGGRGSWIDVRQFVVTARLLLGDLVVALRLTIPALWFALMNALSAAVGQPCCPKSWIRSGTLWNLSGHRGNLQFF